MSAPFKVGDWVRLIDGSGDTRIRKVIGFEPGSDGVDVGEKCRQGGAVNWWYPNGLTRVRVTFPKPKRKLTLSQGLAWLKTCPGLALTSDGDEWGIWNIKDSEYVGSDCTSYSTPTKAIAAARRALGVKS